MNLDKQLARTRMWATTGFWEYSPYDLEILSEARQREAIIQNLKDRLKQHATNEKNKIGRK